MYSTLALIDKTHKKKVYITMDILCFPSGKKRQLYRNSGISKPCLTLCLQSIYEGRLFVCFVLFVLMRSSEQGCFRSRSWSLWKALKEEGCIGFGFMVFGLAV
jgi:hypothetical protein